MGSLRTSDAVARKGVPAVLVALAVGCAAKALPTPAPAKSKPTAAPQAEGQKHAVATEHEAASKIARDVLRLGGDAVDAAAAAALALGVATPTACGVGGGGFAVVFRQKTKEVYVLDFRETAPAGLDVTALDARPLPPDKRGHLVGVPGEIAGLAKLVQKFGKRSFREDVLPAAELAEQGFMLSAHVARAAGYFEKPLRALVPTLGARLLGGGGPLPVGTKVVREDLARTLHTIAQQGPKAFYDGPLSEAMVDAAKAVGGTLTRKDLADYAPKERKPLTLQMGARTLYTMPAPSSGGLMLAQAMVARAHLGAMKIDSGVYLHTVAELMRGSLDDRARFVGDPEATPYDLAPLYAEARMKARLAKISPDKTHPPVELRIDEHGTSHLSIVDAEGNAVALTTTVNGPFGAKIVAGDTGILLNDQLDDFGKTADAIEKKPNVPRAGARPTSSMTPTVVIEDGKVIAVAGGSGGPRIATSVTLVMLARLVFGAAPGDAVGWPRIHATGSKLLLEPSFGTELGDDLTKRGETVEVTDALNAVQLIVVEPRPTGRWLGAAADPRKGGLSLAD